LFQIDPGPRRYLTELCDQIVCLLSSEHSQAIVWGDKDDDDVSAGLDNKDSGWLSDFVVAKKTAQEESLIARPGFTVQFFMKWSFTPLTLNLIPSKDRLSAFCLSTITALGSRRPQGPISEANIWRDYARFHDSRVQTAGDVGRELCSRRPECLTYPPSSVSIYYDSKHRLDEIAFQR
jgi:hypothetical protein